LLPSLTEAYAGVQLATEYTPAEEVGGDFYDIFPIPDDGLALVMGDVSGKGIPAALLMGVIHGAVRSSAWTESAARHQRESELLNRLLCERASRERYASMFWCYYDPATGALRYVNAGHCPPLLARNHGVSRLDAGGPVLGILEAAEYQQAAQPVKSGDVLAMYSDGLVEATNPSGEEYGESRLRDLLSTVRERSADEIRRAILASLEAFSGGSPLQDDLTLVVAKFGSLAGPTPR
jgi:sigma-B regulation protein RsbU (phosphoserine phosphatase)